VIKAILKKELKDVFGSPLIYILSGLFSFMMGWLFFNYLQQAKNLSTANIGQAVITPLFGNINFIFIFLAPLITMRSFAEEQKQHTLDLLLCSKLTLLQIVWGKFLAYFSMICFMLLFTLIFPLILSFSGYNDWGVVLTSYLGVVFSIMAYLAAGLFFSSITDNQILAALLTFCFLLGSMLLVITVNATNNYIFAVMIQYLTIPFHYEAFSKGIIRSYSLVYFVSFVGFFFLLTVKSLQSRKW
jgi:ABC-2 type transport system permease protein